MNLRDMAVKEPQRAGPLRTVVPEPCRRAALTVRPVPPVPDSVLQQPDLAVGKHRCAVSLHFGTEPRLPNTLRQFRIPVSHFRERGGGEDVIRIGFPVRSVRPRLVVRAVKNLAEGPEPGHCSHGSRGKVEYNWKL